MKVIGGRYTVVTYGCQMNEHESEKIAGILKGLGMSACDSAEEADVVVFNTCCIRENAERHAYGNIGALKPLKRKKPDLIIAVGGCMTQRPGAAEKLRQTFPFVDIIFGTHNLGDLGRMIEERVSGKKRATEIVEDGIDPEGIPAERKSFPNGWVNINYGCDNFCTYCIVPYVRGRERSRTPEAIVGEVESLVGAGYKEITLLGQNVNSYGKDLGGTDFSDLLEKVCAIDGKFRVRFMSNHPKDFDDKLIEKIATLEKVCHSVHLPVQSGSDRILKLMNRRYTAEKYLERLSSLRRAVPDCAVTTDIMVGFPTETDEDFRDTMELVRTASFDGAFTFVYSRRPGTVADRMDGQVDEDIKKERIMKLVELQNEITRSRSAAYDGREIEILCEDFDAKKGMYIGRDEYGRMGYFRSDKNLVGNFVKIKIVDCSGISLYGELIMEE